MATAYVASLTISGMSYYFTCSDVNGEYWINATDGSSDLVLAQGGVINDAFFSTTAGTTNRVAILAGGIDTGRILIQNQNQGTTVQNQVRTNPIRVNPGAKLRFKMLT
jgi:hypothetical protein